MDKSKLEKEFDHICNSMYDHLKIKQEAGFVSEAEAFELELMITNLIENKTDKLLEKIRQLEELDKNNYYQPYMPQFDKPQQSYYDNKMYGDNGFTSKEVKLMRERFHYMKSKERQFDSHQDFNMQEDDWRSSGC